MNIAQLKAYVEEHVSTVGAEVAYHVRAFVDFVEGKETTAEAVAYLTSHGYTITPPVEAA